MRRNTGKKNYNNSCEIVSRQSQKRWNIAIDAENRSRYYYYILISLIFHNFDIISTLIDFPANSLVR